MEPINWSALTPAQRNEEIHEKVMGHARKIATHTSRTRAGDSFSYNVTSWQTGGPDTPRYSQSMDAAWTVLQEMAKRKQPKFQPFTLFVEAMLTASGWGNASAWSEIYPAYEIFMMAAVRWTPEIICVAALKGCGYEVLTEEASQ